MEVPGVECPGPKGYPLIGHIPYFFSPNYFIQLTSWANEYGGIYKLSMPGATYVISDAQLAATVLASRGEGMCHKAPQIYDLFSELSFDEPNVFNDSKDGDQWRVWRKAMAVCFSKESIKASFPTTRSHAERLVSIWQDLHASDPGQAIDIEPWIQRCFLDILGNDFAMEFNALGGGHCEIFEVTQNALKELSYRVANPLRRPYHRLLPFTRSAREAHNAIARFKEVFWNFLDEFRARGEPAPEDQRLWASLMRVRDPSTNLPYPDTVVAGNLGTALVAGFHTTTYSTMWALYDIARHPDMQKRIVQELADAGLLQVQGQPKSRQLEWADLSESSTPYFNAVVKESMRTSPVASTGTLRRAPHDMDLGGYLIPKGATLWIPIHSVHLSNCNFSEPTTFDPERWLRQHEQPSSPPSAPPSCPCYVPGSLPTHKGNAAALTKSMLPFSDGPRNCVGLNFANANLRAVLLTILSQFWLELDPSVSNHNDVVNAQVLSLILRCDIPIKLLLKPHIQR